VRNRTSKFLVAFILAALTFMSLVDASNSTEQDDAIKAARVIMASIGDRNFDKLWDETADYYKDRSGMKKPSFLANWTITRQQYGLLNDSTVLDTTMTTTDPAIPNRKVFTVTFVNTYAWGKAYERIVLVEENGKYRLTNFFSAPQ